MEKYELVNINGERTGKIITDIEIKNIENIPNGYYISVVGVVIINNKNEVLVQKRSKFKKINPSKWGICGGKVDFGEDTVDAACRETFEEIGVVIDKKRLKPLTKFVFDKVYYTTYYINQDVDLNECKLQTEEVEKVKYCKIEDLDKLNNEGFEWLDKLKEICQTK